MVSYVYIEAVSRYRGLEEAQKGTKKGPKMGSQNGPNVQYSFLRARARVRGLVAAPRSPKSRVSDPGYPI